MSKDWELKALSDICIIEKTKKITLDLPYVGLENIESNTGNFLGTLIPLEVKSSTFQFSSNHILYGRLRPYLNKVLMPDFEGHCSTEIFPIKINSRIKKEFLYYWLTSPLIVEKIDATCTGARMPRANMNEVMKFQLLIPEIEEQKQIIEILDTAFEALEKAKKNIETNLKNTKELFDSKLNEIFFQEGEGWEEKTLGEVCSLFQGLAINAKTKHLLVEKSNLPLLRIKDLKNNTEEQYISENDYPLKSRVFKNEIIYTRTGSLGLVFRNREGILHNNSFKVIPNEELDNDYLFWWLQHEKFTYKIIQLSSKAAQPDITHKLFKEQEIIIPPIKKQKEFYIEIVKLDKYIKQLEQKYQEKLDNIEELKKSLLQKAFSGELTK